MSEAARSAEERRLEAQARVRALLPYVEREQRAFLASQLDQRALFGREDDALASQLCEVGADEVKAYLREEAAYHEAHQDRLDALAADAPTRAVLRARWEGRFACEQDRRGEPQMLDLLLQGRGRKVRVRCPDLQEPLLILFEVFLRDSYFIDDPAPLIYDLGANIGLASLYLHSVHPSAELVCVEPVAESCALLAYNLGRNAIRARVVRAAIAAHTGRTRLRRYHEAPGLSSTARVDAEGSALVERASTVEEVRCARIDEIVTGSDYGLKLDIEGAEHLLADHPEVITRARWIVGELHLGPGVVPVARARALEELMRRHFEVRMEGPGFFGDTITRNFVARRR